MKEEWVKCSTIYSTKSRQIESRPFPFIQVSGRRTRSMCFQWEFVARTPISVCVCSFSPCVPFKPPTAVVVVNTTTIIIVIAIITTRSVTPLSPSLTVCVCVCVALLLHYSFTLLLFTIASQSTHTHINSLTYQTVVRLLRLVLPSGASVVSFVSFFVLIGFFSFVFAKKTCRNWLFVCRLERRFFSIFFESLGFGRN